MSGYLISLFFRRQTSLALAPSPSWVKKSLSNLRFSLEISASRPCHASLRTRRVGEVTFEVAHLGESLSRRHKDTEKTSCSERRRPRRHHRLVLRFASFLRLPTLGYTFASFAPAQLALRANLRLVYLAPAPALDCLSLGIVAIARVVAPLRYGCLVRARLISLRFTLRAAFGSHSLCVRLCRPTGCYLCSLPRKSPICLVPSQRPLACVQVSSFQFQIFSLLPPQMSNQCC